MKQCPECGSYNTDNRLNCFRCDHDFPPRQSVKDNLHLPEDQFMDIESAINIHAEFDTIEHIMGSFHIKRNYIPADEKEKKVFDDFSFIVSAMVLMIHVAMADRVLDESEKARIKADMYYQLTTGRKSEYDDLSAIFGKCEHEIIDNLFNYILLKYEIGELGIENILDNINLIYQNNPRKKYFFIRLCFYCAFADQRIVEDEESEIAAIAARLGISRDETEHIRHQVSQEVSAISD